MTLPHGAIRPVRGRSSRASAAVRPSSEAGPAGSPDPRARTLGRGRSGPAPGEGGEARSDSETRPGLGDVSTDLISQSVDVLEALLAPDSSLEADVDFPSVEIP